MALVNMKLPKSKKNNCSPEVCRSEPYPYGLELSLEKEAIDKLNLDINSFVIGGKVDIVCRAEVTNLSQSVAKKDENLSIRLQITDMNMSECKNENPKKLRDTIKLLKK